MQIGFAEHMQIYHIDILTEFELGIEANRILKNVNKISMK